MRKQMKIGILQTGRTPEQLRQKHGDYNDMFISLLGGRGFEFETYPVLDGVFPKNTTQADGWLITGSRFSAYDDLQWIRRLKEFLREAYQKGVPIVGVCFGHQVLALALGGTVEKYKGGWSVGVKEYTSLIGQKNSRILAWHQDQILSAPEGAKTIERSDFCRYAMLAYGDKALSVQPHPEFNNGFVIDLIAARKGILPPEIVKDALNSVSKKHVDVNLDGSGLTSATMADQFEEFFKRHRNKTENILADKQGEQ